MHTPLYIENVTEIHAADKGKSLRQEHSLVFILEIEDNLYNIIDFKTIVTFLQISIILNCLKRLFTRTF